MSDKTGCKKPSNFFPGNSFCIAPSCWPTRWLSAVCRSVMFVTQLRASLGGSGKYSGGIGKLEKRKQTTLQIVDPGI